MNAEREELRQDRHILHTWAAAKASCSGLRPAGRYASNPVGHAGPASNKSGGAALPARRAGCPPASSMKDILAFGERKSAHERVVPPSQRYIRRPAARYEPSPSRNAGSSFSSTSTGAAFSFRVEPMVFFPTVAWSSRNDHITHGCTSTGAASSLPAEAAAFSPLKARLSRRKGPTRGRTRADDASFLVVEPAAFSQTTAGSSRHGRATQSRTPSRLQHGTRAPFDRNTRIRHWNAMPGTTVTNSDTVFGSRSSLAEHQPVAGAREELFLRPNWATHVSAAAQLQYRTQHCRVHCLRAAPWQQWGANASPIDMSRARGAGGSPRPTGQAAFEGTPVAGGALDKLDGNKQSGTNMQPSPQPAITAHSTARSRYSRLVNSLRGPLRANLAAFDTIEVRSPSGGCGQYRYSSVPPQHIHPPLVMLHGAPHSRKSHATNPPWDSRVDREGGNAGITPGQTLASENPVLPVLKLGARLSPEWRRTKGQPLFHQQHDRRLPCEQDPGPLHGAVSNTASLAPSSAFTNRAAVAGRVTVTVPMTTADAISRVATTARNNSFACATAAADMSGGTGKGAVVNELQQSVAFARLSQRRLGMPQEDCAELALREARITDQDLKLSKGAVRQSATVSVSLPEAGNAVTPLMRATTTDGLKNTSKTAAPTVRHDEIPHVTSKSPKPSDGAELLQAGGDSISPTENTCSACSITDACAAPLSVHSALCKNHNAVARVRHAAPTGSWGTLNSVRPPAARTTARAPRAGTADAVHEVAEPFDAQILLGGREVSSEVATVASLKVVTTAVPQQATTTRLQSPKAAEKTLLSKNLREAGPSKSAGLGLGSQVTVASPVEGAGGAVCSKAVFAALSNATSAATPPNAGGATTQPSHVVYSLAGKSSSGDPSSKVTSGYTAAKATNATDWAPWKTPAGATGKIAPAKNCSPQSRLARSQTQLENNNMKQGQTRACSPSSPSSSSSTTSSSSSDSTSTTSVTSSNSESPETCSDSGNKSSSGFDTDFDSHPGSCVLRQSVISEGLASSPSNSCETLFHAEKELWTGTYVRGQKKRVCSPLKGLALAVGPLNAGAPPAKEDARVISRDDDVTRLLNACESPLYSRTIELRGGDARQSTGDGVATGGNAEIGDSKIARVSNSPIVTTVTTDSANAGREQVLPSQSESPGNVQERPPNNALSFQQQTVPSVRQAGNAPANTVVDGEFSAATNEDSTKHLKPETLARSPTGAAKRCAEPVETTKMPFTTITDRDPSHVLLASPSRRKSFCGHVQNVHGSKQRNAVFRSESIPREDSCDTAAAAKPRNISAAVFSSRRRGTRIVSQVLSGANGTTSVQSVSSGVAPEVKVTSTAAAAKTAVTAGYHSAAASQGSLLCNITTARAHVRDAGASSTVAPAERPRTQKTLPSKKVAALFPACGVPPPLTSPGTQAPSLITLAPAPAVPESLTTNVVDTTEGNDTLIDGPCACELTPPGLVNLGKTCSFNALLQALSATRVFSEFCNELNFSKMHAARVTVSENTEAKARMNEAAATSDQSEEKKTSKAHFTKLRKKAKSGEFVPVCTEAAPEPLSEGSEQSTLKETEKDTTTTGTGEIVHNEQTGSSKRQRTHQVSHTCSGCAAHIRVDPGQGHPAESLPYTSAQGGAVFASVNSRDLTVCSSLAAILYQMCNGISLNGRTEGHDADISTKTVEAAPAAYEEQQLQNARKQIRLLQQLRTRKWYEQQHGVLDPTDFVTQVKVLNAEFQHDAELDVEEVWRFIADRLLQEADCECRRLALLQAASSHSKQQRPTTEKLGGNCKRQKTVVDEFLLHNRGDERNECESKDDQVTSPSTRQGPPDDAPEERRSTTMREATPVRRCRSDSESTNSPNVCGSEYEKEEGVLSLSKDEGVLSPSPANKNHFQQESSPTAEDSPCRCAACTDKAPVMSEKLLRQGRHNIQEQEGREREQQTVGGATLCVAKVSTHWNNMDSRTLSTSSPVCKVRKNAHEDTKARILLKGLHPVVPTQGFLSRLESDGSHVSEQPIRRSESSCRLADTSSGRNLPKELESNCRLPGDTRSCASCFSRFTSSSDWNGNCSSVELPQQTQTDEVATRLRAALALSRRLQIALTGKLVHVPIACRCCCYCPNGLLPCSKLSDSTNKVSFKKSSSSNTTPSLLQTNALSSKASSTGSITTNSNSTFANNDSSPSFLRKSSHAACSRDFSVSKLHSRLLQGGVRGRNERSGKSDSSCHGTSNFNIGPPASCYSAINNSDPQTKDFEKNALTCAREPSRQSTSGTRRPRRRLRRPPRESESEREAHDRCGQAQRRTGSIIPEPTVPSAESKPIETTLTELLSDGLHSEGHVPAVSSSGATSRNRTCSNRSTMRTRLRSGDSTLHLRSDGTAKTQQRVQEFCQHLRSAPPIVVGGCVPPRDCCARGPSAVIVPHPHPQVLATVQNLASSITSDFLPASASTDLSAHPPSLAESVSKCPSVCTIPDTEARLLMSSTAATDTHEEQFSAALSLRLPERSRWMASRSHGTWRPQARSAEAARSPIQGKEGPITLGECLSLALEHRCSGERAVTAAQKMVARTEKRGRFLAAAAQQSRCRQRGPRGRKVAEEVDVSRLTLCSVCGKFAGQLCKEAHVEVKAGSGCKRDAQQSEGACAASAPGRRMYAEDLDELVTSSVNKLYLSSSPLHTTQEPTRRSDMRYAAGTTANASQSLMCHYCKRVHTKTVIGNLPQLLVLQLQRSCPAETSARHASRAAALASTGGSIKIKAHVQFPDELQETLLPYCEPPVHDEKTPSFDTNGPSPATAVDAQPRYKRGKTASRTPSASLQTSTRGSCSPGPSAATFPWSTSVRPSLSPLNTDDTCKASQSSMVQTSQTRYDGYTPTTLKATVGVYKLRAVIEHQGRSGTGGHYVCFRRGFTCRGLPRTCAQGLLIASRAVTAPSASTADDTALSNGCGAVPLFSTACAEASPALVGTSSGATRSSNAVHSIKACRPSSFLSAKTCRLEKADRSCLTLNSAETHSSYSFRASVRPKSTAACVRQVHQQETWTASVVQADPVAEAQNRTSQGLTAVEDRQSRQPPQVRVETSRRRYSRRNKRMRSQNQGISASSEEAESQVRNAVTDASTTARLSSSSKHHFTHSATNRDQDGDEALILFPSPASLARADHGGFLGGEPPAPSGPKPNRWRRKKEAKPTERDVLEEDEDWWEVNDTRACRTTWHQVSLCQAYLLIYELEKPAHAICRKRRLRAALQASKSEEERKSEKQRPGGKQKSAKGAATNAHVELRTSTSRSVSRRVAGKSSAVAARTRQTARGRKRARSAQVHEDLKSTRRVESIKRIKEH